MKYLLTAILFLALLAGAFLAGSWYTKSETAKVRAPETKSPPVSAHGKHGAVTDTDMDDSSLPPGTVRITPDKQLIIGVRTGVVEKAAVAHFIRTLGRVAPYEKRVYRLVAGTDGWIRETYSNGTGTFVKKDERLATFTIPCFGPPRSTTCPCLVHHRTSAMTLAEGRRSRPPSWQPSISRPMSTRWKASA